MHRNTAALFVVSLFLLSGCDRISRHLLDKLNPPGFSSGYERVDGVVEDVYSAAETNGAEYRGYVVDWRGRKVVVTDTIGKSPKQKGDAIEYMAHWTVISQMGMTNKILNFITLH